MHISPCSSLDEATMYGHPRGKQRGIWRWAYTNMTTRKPSRTYFGAKSGDHTDKGLIFNYCPYCGTQIDSPFAESIEG
jgi:hypothetical protein